MRIEGQAKLLRIYIGETDRWHGQPLYMAILLKAREMGLAGGTVFRGIAGYGANSVIHTANILRLSEDLPVVIEIVDTDEKIQAFLPVLDEMVKEGLILMREVEVIKYAGNRGRRRAHAPASPASSGARSRGKATAYIAAQARYSAIPSPCAGLSPCLGMR
jgi:PII-like signaling protein